MFRFGLDKGISSTQAYSLCSSSSSIMAAICGAARLAYALRLKVASAAAAARACACSVCVGGGLGRDSLTTAGARVCVLRLRGLPTVASDFSLPLLPRRVKAGICSDRVSVITVTNENG